MDTHTVHDVIEALQRFADSEERFKYLQTNMQSGCSFGTLVKYMAVEPLFQRAVSWAETQLNNRIVALTEEELKTIAQDERVKALPPQVARPLLDALSKCSVGLDSAGRELVQVAGEEASSSEDQSDSNCVGIEGTSVPSTSNGTHSRASWASFRSLFSGNSLSKAFSLSQNSKAPSNSSRGNEDAQAR